MSQFELLSTAPAAAPSEVATSRAGATPARRRSWDRLVLRTADRLDGVCDFARRLRTILLWGLVSHEFVQNECVASYALDVTYHPDERRFREGLFVWEERALSAYFPPPPARILLGAAGGGREAFALARRGYEVVAFEPSRSLVEAMVRRTPADVQLDVYQASYEDLPSLRAMNAAGTVKLTELDRFDAAIMGWGSLSHLLDHVSRATALRHFAQVTNGPILASFGTRSPAQGGRSRWGRLRSWLPQRFQIEDGTHYWKGLGFFHNYLQSEIEQMADGVGLRVAVFSPWQEESYGHAVFLPMTQSSQSQMPDATNLR